MLGSQEVQWDLSGAGSKQTLCLLEGEEVQICTSSQEKAPALF